MRLPTLFILLVPLVACQHARTTDAHRSETTDNKADDKKSDDKKSDDKKSDDKKSDDKKTDSKKADDKAEVKKDERSSDSKAAKSDKPAEKHESAEPKSKTAELKTETHSKDGAISEPGHPILSVSPEGLRKPGGTMEIKKALNKAGFLADVADSSEDDLRKALIKFQEKHELAKTGFADHETIRKLGLNPKDIDLSQMPRKEAGGT